jgi:hypothetical protein
MTRQTATNFTGPLQFPYATAGTDVFMKEDVQVLAQATDPAYLSADGDHIVGAPPA